jgi:hypothetical protein
MQPIHSPSPIDPSHHDLTPMPSPLPPRVPGLLREALCPHAAAVSGAAVSIRTRQAAPGAGELERSATPCGDTRRTDEDTAQPSPMPAPEQPGPPLTTWSALRSGPLPTQGLGSTAATEIPARPAMPARCELISRCAQPRPDIKIFGITIWPRDRAFKKVLAALDAHDLAMGDSVNLFDAAGAALRAHYELTSALRHYVKAPAWRGHRHKDVLRPLLGQVDVEHATAFRAVELVMRNESLHRHTAGAAKLTLGGLASLYRQGCRDDEVLTLIASCRRQSLDVTAHSVAGLLAEFDWSPGARLG